MEKRQSLIHEGNSKGREPTLTTHASLVNIASDDKPQQDTEIFDGIARGEIAITEGRVLTSTEAKARMSRWLKSPKRGSL